MASLNANDGNPAPAPRYLVAIEFLFINLPSDRQAHLSQVLQDNYASHHFNDIVWYYDSSINSMKMNHHPIRCNHIDLQNIYQEMNKANRNLIYKYNNICRTRVRYFDCKLHFA